MLWRIEKITRFVLLHINAIDCIARIVLPFLVLLDVF